MPTVLPKAHRSDAVRPFRAKAVWLSLAASAAVVGLGAWWLHTAHLAASRPAAVVTSTPTPTCSAPDQSFCPTAALFERYVTQSDFADILERQASMRVTCGPVNATDGVCAGITGTAAVTAFAVQEGSATTYLTNNGYINFLRSYADQAGTFSLTGITTAGPVVTMAFIGAHHTKTLSLKFQSTAGAWQLLYPVTE